LINPRHWRTPEGRISVVMTSLNIRRILLKNGKKKDKDGFQKKG